MKYITPGTPIGFIGLGVMGKSMAGNLLSAEYPLHVYNRTRSKADELVARGAVWESSPAALAGKVQAVITMAGYPKDVEELYLGSGGIVAHAAPGTLLIDMTTSSPALAGRISGEAKARGMRCLDAPVSGGDIGAREARLSIMVGGEAADLEAALPLLEVMGKQIVLHGGPGSGQKAKICNQICVAGTMMGVCEALAFAERSGLDLAKVLQTVGSGAAASTAWNNLGPRIAAGDFAAGFYVHHFIKDLEIALESAREIGFEAPATDLAKRLYERLADRGEGNSGSQALFRLLTQPRE